MNDKWYGVPYTAAMSGTYENFVAVYEGSQDETEVKTNSDPRIAELLWRAARNSNVDARIAICNRLMDDGVDAAYEDRKTNVLHIYFSNRKYDMEREPPLLRRFLEAGADLNLETPKEYSPIVTFLMNTWLPESERAPFYDVLLDFPEFMYRMPDGSLRWPHRPTLTARIEAHEAHVGKEGGL